MKIGNWPPARTPYGSERSLKPWPRPDDPNELEKEESEQKEQGSLHSSEIQSHQGGLETGANSLGFCKFQTNIK